MSLDKREHRLLIPYCLAMGAAGIIVIALLSQVWPMGLPVLSYQFWILTFLGIIFGSLGFYIGKDSLHVSLGSIFEVALLLSFGPMTTIVISTFSYAVALILRQIDRVYIRKLPLLRPWREHFAIMFFSGSMMTFMWVVSGAIYQRFACHNCSNAQYLFSLDLLLILAIGAINTTINSFFLAIYQKLRGLSTIVEYFTKDFPSIVLFEVAVVPVGILLAVVYETMGWGGYYWFILMLMAIGALLRTLSNTRQDLESRLAAFNVVNQFGRAANSTFNLDELLMQTYQKTCAFLEPANFAIALLEEDKQTIKIPLIIHDGVRETPQAIKLGEGGISYIINDKRAINLRSKEEVEALGIKQVIFSSGKLLESYLGVPIIMGEQVLGAIVVKHPHVGAFDNNHMQTLMIVADQLAGAIHNARSYLEMEQSFLSMKEINRIKDEFLNNISHELRTPLTVIMGWGELMSYGKLSDSQQHSAVEQINKSSQRLLHLVNSLLDLSKLEKGSLKLEYQETNINTPLQLAIEENMVDASSKNMELTADLTPLLPYIKVDPMRVQQIFTNIINNAIKFTLEGGLISVRSEFYQSKVLVSISDNGIGIASNALPHIFERFSQADTSTTRKYGGVGVGLSLVKKLMDLHGAEINVDSEVGKGTTFNLLFPVNPITLKKFQDSFETSRSEE